LLEEKEPVIASELNTLGVMTDLMLLVSCLFLGYAAVIWLARIVGLLRSAAAMVLPVGRRGSRVSASESLVPTQMHIRLH
jgi:hypothetical protein